MFFQEKHNLMIALDSDGEFISIDPPGHRDSSAKLRIACHKITIGQRQVDEKINTMLRACRKSNGDNQSLLPPPVIAKTKDGRSMLVEAMHLPRDLGALIGGARFMISVREVSSPRNSRKSRMRRVYGLTTTEADFADLLACGKSVREASELLAISVWTGRSHLRSIFQKTDTHRQGELIALLNQEEI
ncbi:helix-turn-helix transcriptional regulator [Yoonia sediminilitoris]|uniref:DNA-binding CsgD family transcriptional regulator n=1 Tax=Yoonia sediminilitoris TaxID=1286148 RepID=A0A2T6K8P2_9RHOB|nr:helix-turn-helix transcriptional regulator [Yoonia sediminilitoris]PUB11096.1 DNA-binding CsgD family transcriptional regulator [Yoonia sediminilitoris]RCW91015.1 DNA-binding CsgD family transcriptional regulator [Yoonia sediminilitoris]